MSWNFRSETFDCIASLATFPHVPLRETLSRMRDSLKIGGVLPVLDLFGRERNVFKPEGLFEQETSGSFFNIDGSMLLVDIDPSTASKALQVRKFIEANLDGTDLEYWVKTMARRGVEGFDTSEAGAKWLSYPRAKYNLALHGGFPVDSFIGAVFIFGSMDEELATPVLLRMANQVGHPHRDDALAILMSQATPASLRALKQINAAGFPAGTSQSIRELLENPNLLKPRAHPKLTREEQLIAFQGIIDGDYRIGRAHV